jgi:hypothetical protein
MQSVLEQLKSDESLLLMYMADELSGEDRAQLEARLEREPDLRAQLEQVRALNDSVADAITGLDSSMRLPVSEGVAVRKVVRVMRQWQSDRMAPRPPEEPVDQLRFPWWSYPLATAAAVLIAFIVWWGAQDGPPEPRGRRASGNAPWEMERPYVMDWNEITMHRLARSLSEGYETDGLGFEADIMASAEIELDDVDAIFMVPPKEIERTW